MSESIRVLHVDDDPESTAVVAEKLERQDGRLVVESATSVSEGLEALETGAFDCVVSDYQMPWMDGLSFFEEVHERDADVPFLIFTGRQSGSVAAEALSAGVTDVVRKNPNTDQYALLANAICGAVDRVRAERRAAKTRERFEVLLAETGDFILVTDTDGTIDYVTPAVADALGHEPERLTGTSAFEWLHPDDRGAVIDQFVTNVEEPGAEWTLEARAKHSDGSWRWLEVTCRNRRDDGVVEGVVGNVRDVTERKEQAEAVDWHRTVIEQMGEGVYILDSDHRVRFADGRAGDPEALSVPEWQDDPDASLSDIDILSEAEVTAIESAIDDLLAGDAGEIRMELSPSAPESDEVIELRLVPLPVAGEPPYVLGTTRDVTGRRERERKLRKTTERYETLIENFPNGGVFVFDENLEYLLAGGTELSEVGLSPSAIEGAQPRDLFPPEIATETERYYKATLRGERATYEQEYEGRHYRVHTLPLRNGSADVTTGMAVSQNVTARKARRQELERQNERLDDFASVVSHDLRNPLSVLATSLELAEETGETDHFERCYRSLDRMEQLLDDLLTLAKQGEQITDRSPVDLRAVVNQCWDIVNAPAATLEGTVDLTVSADEGRLRQLLENLFRNAVEHGSTGSPAESGDASDHARPGQSEAVTITVGDLDDGFYVADDGQGIPPEERSAVFDSGYSTAVDGTGFGLSIVEEIVDAHGWEITVTESEDGGARFEVTGVDTVAASPPDAE